MLEKGHGGLFKAPIMKEISYSLQRACFQSYCASSTIFMRFYMKLVASFFLSMNTLISLLYKLIV